MREPKQQLRENQDYDAMFNSLLSGDREGAMMAASLVKSARLQLKRYDWVVWYLRWMRLALLWDRMLEGKVEARKVAEYAHRMAARLGVPSGHIVNWMRSSPGYDGLMDWIINVAHFRSLPIQQIIDYRPTTEMPTALLKHFGELEQKWKEGSKNLIVAQSGDKRILQVGKGLAWWLLDRASCPKEGDSMGHCGNAGRAGSTDRLLSLRQEIRQGPQTFYKPYLTFVLYKDGKLGERKARFNESPKNAAAKGFIPSDFQREIVALLKQPFIKGFGADGHAPQNDFKISDLSPELQEELLDAKPELADLRTTITTATMARIADLPLQYTEGEIMQHGEEEPLWSNTVTFGWLSKHIGMNAAIKEVEAAVRSNGTTATDSGVQGVNLETRERFPMALRVTLDKPFWEKVVKGRTWRAMVSLVEAAVPTDYHEKRKSFTEEGKNIIEGAMVVSAKKAASTLPPILPREIVDGDDEGTAIEVASVEIAEKLALEDYKNNVGEEITVHFIYGYNDNVELDPGGPFDVKVLNTPRENLLHWQDDHLDPMWNITPLDNSPNLDTLPSNWKTIQFWTSGPSYYVPHWKKS